MKKKTINEEIKILKNQIANIERLLEKNIKETEKNKLFFELKNKLQELHILKKRLRGEEIYNKYQSRNGVSDNTEKCNFETVIDDYIKEHTKLKYDDKVKLKDGREGFVEGLYVNTLLIKEGRCGVIVTLKRMSKHGKKHHLWLSKYGVPLEEIEDVMV